MISVTFITISFVDPQRIVSLRSRSPERVREMWKYFCVGYQLHEQQQNVTTIIYETYHTQMEYRLDD